MEYYFAYGSNMNSERMKSRGITWAAKYSAFLKDYELTFNKISTITKNTVYANIASKKESLVEGVLYFLDEDYIKMLDKFEGSNKKIPDYFRIKTKVIKNKTEIVSAWCYIANESFIVEGFQPTKEYMHHLLEGKNYLSEKYFLKLKNIQTNYLL